MIRFLLAILWIGFSSPLLAAFDYPSPTARSAGTGNSHLASTLTVEGFLLNPALSINAGGVHLGLNYFRLYTMKELGFASGYGVLPVRSFAGGIGIQRFGGSLYSETKVTLNVAGQFYKGRFAAGVSLHWYQVSARNYPALTAVGVDVGVRVQVTPGVHFAAVVENLNRPHLGGHEEELPQGIRMGVEYRPVEGLAIYAAVEKDGRYAPEVHVGMAYRLVPSLALFSGFSTYTSVPALGIELKVTRLRVNYTIQHHFDLGPTHFVGIAFGAGR